MKYLVTLSNDYTHERYHEWAQTDRDLLQIVSRITKGMKNGDTMIVTDLYTGRLRQERRKVVA